LSDIDQSLPTAGNWRQLLALTHEFGAQSSEVLERDFARSLSAFVVTTLLGISADVRVLKTEIGISVQHLQAELDSTSLQIPMKKPNSLDRIISYLAKGRAGNLQDRGLLHVTSGPVGEPEKGLKTPAVSPKSLADFLRGRAFFSLNQTGQWICWYFCELRLRLTHCPIWSDYLTSWSELDGH
jgi:hypothetical protein